MIRFLMEWSKLVENVFLPALMAISGAIIWTGMVPERKDFAAPAFLSWGLLVLFLGGLAKLRIGLSFLRPTLLIWLAGLALMVVAAPQGILGIAYLMILLIAAALIAALGLAVLFAITKGVPALIRAIPEVFWRLRIETHHWRRVLRGRGLTRKTARSLFVYEILRIDPSAEPRGYETLTQVGVIYPYPVDEVKGPRREEATWIGTKREFEALAAKEGLDWLDWIHGLHEFHCADCLVHVRIVRPEPFAPVYIRCPRCGRKFIDFGWHTARDVELPRVVQKWHRQRGTQLVPTSPDPVRKGDLKLVAALA